MYLSFFQVKINTNSEETQPGTDVELTVETKPNSYVGILGVDQSVLLLKSGNDITQVNGKTVVYFMPYHLRNVLVASCYFNS
jgi:hypothetical protein